MRTVYTPPKPEPKRKSHRCDVEWWRSYRDEDRYKIVECEHCGQYWFLAGMSLTGYTSWRKIRWYHYNLRKNLTTNQDPC